VGVAPKAGSASGQVVVSYDNIKNKIGIEGLDTNKLEIYLSDQDFLTAMGCSRDEFYKMPQWKQNNKKRMMGLF